jgi:hypothetical protein
MHKPKTLVTLFLKKRLVDAARRTHPIVRELTERNAFNFFVIDPFANTANPFCQLASPAPHFITAHVNNFSTVAVIDRERMTRAIEQPVSDHISTGWMST